MSVSHKVFHVFLNACPIIYIPAQNIQTLVNFNETSVDCGLNCTAAIMIQLSFDITEDVYRNENIW